MRRKMEDKNFYVSNTISFQRQKKVKRYFNTNRNLLPVNSLQNVYQVLPSLNNRDVSYDRIYIDPDLHTFPHKERAS